MASGDFMFAANAGAGIPTISNPAALVAIASGDAEASYKHVAAFSAAADEYFDFYFPAMPAYYDGGGITLKVELQAASATTGDFRVGAAFKARKTTDDWDSDAHSWAFNEATITVPGTVGQSVIVTITFTDGADMDSVAAGDGFVLRMWRDYIHADDDAAGDMYLERVYATET